MEGDLLKKFVLRCEEGHLNGEDVVLDSTQIHAQVEWRHTGHSYHYSLGVVLVNVIRCYRHRLPEWKSLTSKLVTTHQLDVNEAEDDRYGWAVLHHCAWHGDTDFAQLLVNELGGNVNVKEKLTNRTPLHKAALRNSRSDMLEWLLTVPGVDKTVQNWSGRTALDCARCACSRECEVLLLETAEASSGQDANGKTQHTNPPPAVRDGEQADDAKPQTRDMMAVVDHELGAGMTRVRRVRISLCGQFGTGKSSLMDTIRNKEFVQNKSSTLVVDVEQNNVFQQDGVLKVEPGRTTMHFLGGEFCKLAKQLESERQESQRADEARKKEERAKQEELRVLERTARPQLSKHDESEQETAELSSVDTAGKMTENLPHASPTARVSELRPVLEAEFTQPPAMPPSAAATAPKHPTPSIDMVKLKTELIDEILADEELMREIGDKEVIVSVWDCGGQSIFSSMQHFLTGDSEEYIVYILCFSAVDDLKGVKQQMYTRLGTTDSSAGRLVAIEVPEYLQNIDHIRHWLTTIHLASMTSSQEKPEKYPPVIMVGNFADKLDSSISLPEHKTIIWNELKELCYRSPTFNGMLHDTSRVSTRDQDSLFLIDNTKSGSSDTLSPQVEALCHTLQRATSIILEGKQIKKQWLRFEWILKHLNDVKGRPGYTDRQSIARLAKTACDMRDDGDLEEMLLFYDRLRLIIYKPTPGRSLEHSDGCTNDDIIIYSVSWLIGQINRLIFGPLAEGDAADQHRDEDAGTADLRQRLSEKGILVQGLVSQAWKHNKPEVSNKILDVMAAWNLLYEYTADAGTARRKREFFVPSALQKKPTHSVLDAMRENGDASADELLVSTSDCPLLIMLQDGGEYCMPDPDTPLPHSCYCQLLVKLLKTWRINITQKKKCVLAYNCVRIKVPKPVLESVFTLADFRGHVEVFLAHYDSSGAVLVSLSFKHARSSFEQGHLKLPSGKRVQIAAVCCQVRDIIYQELKDLRDPQLPQLKVFSVPLRPTCDCDLEKWRDKRTSSIDLGYVPWKVKFESKEQPTAEGSRGRFSSVYTECELCGEESEARENGRWWSESTVCLETSDQDSRGKSDNASNPPPAARGLEPSAAGGSPSMQSSSCAGAASSIPNGDKQLASCPNLANLAEGLEPFVLHKIGEFAKWAVQQIEPTMAGLEENVLSIYYRKHKVGGLNSCDDYKHILCVLHYLSNKKEGPTIDQIYEQLASLCYDRKADILAMFQKVQSK